MHELEALERDVPRARCAARRTLFARSRLQGLSSWRSGEELVRRPAKGGTRDGKEIWRDIRGWTLQADAPSLRLVDKASAQKIPGRRAESGAGAGRHPTVGRGGTPVERGRLGWSEPGARQLLYAGRTGGGA